MKWETNVLTSVKSLLVTTTREMCSFLGGFRNSVLFRQRSISCIFICWINAPRHCIVQSNPKIPLPFYSRAQNKIWNIYSTWPQENVKRLYSLLLESNLNGGYWMKLIVFLPDTWDHVRNTTSTCVLGSTLARSCVVCWDSGSGSLMSGPGMWTLPTNWSLEGSQGE